MLALTLDDRSDLQRWLLCGVVVLAIHAGLATALVQWHEPVDSGEESGGDYVYAELTPEQVQGNPTPDKPIEKVDEEKIVPLPQEESEATLPTKPPEPQPVPQPQDTAADQATKAKQLAQIRAGIANWDREISKLLEHSKRYPSRARERGEQGVATLEFTIDRQGFVLSSRIVKSSGSAALDEETLALVKRAQPFPVPPEALPDTGLILTVPVSFAIR